MSQSNNSLTEAHNDAIEPSITLCVGDNLSYLKKYEKEYSEKVDVIYIDPPYDTGNDFFLYNDSFTNGDWERIMQDRLELAYSYLSDTGVIMVSIGDQKHHMLRNILDNVFGVKNFVSNIVWLGSGGSSKVRFDRGGIDYIVVYAKNRNKAPVWFEEKPGLERMFSLMNDCKKKKLSIFESEQLLKNLLNKYADQYSGGMKSYCKVDENYEIYTTVSLVNSLYRPNLMYDVVDDKTGHVYPSPEKGWTISKEYFKKLYDNDLIVFSGNRPRKKLLLKDMRFQKPLPIIRENRSKAHNELERIVGKTIFVIAKM